ncbi:DNA cytosine methyltransferase [Megasphaera sueciensis]|uniref:DNA cytosine methyltransferase n=1 Tax=Megasphaera sueciensis TaxID=349094 RepID=UPI003D01336B
MNMLSLFSGVGMIDLAASWCGINTVAFCEIEEYPQEILQKRFKGVPIYDDVIKLTAAKLRQDSVPSIDIICGGFPCQDVSTAGKRKGFKDEEGNCTRSGLWTEYARLIGEIKPKWIVAENVRGLLSIEAMGRRGGGFGIILRDLAEMGYDAAWSCYGASDVGAPHKRERVFVVAHTRCQ